MNISDKPEQILSTEGIPCSFCRRDAAVWLIPGELNFGPDEPLPSLCDTCAGVLSCVMEQLPKNTNSWAFVELEWLLRPITDEEEAVWAAEDLLGLGPMGDEVAN